MAAIAWLDDHAPAGAVVLESVGPDYSAFGHARISTFTGLPTVLGWPGHERQWAHDVGTREQDVERMYRGGAAEARPLLRRYGVRYVVVGPIERTDHGDAGVAKWDELGRRVFDREGTEVWDLARPPGPAPRRPRSRPAAQVQPLGQAARRVPRLALRVPAPPAAGRHRAVVAHPPDAEREAAAVVAGELAAQPVAVALGEDCLLYTSPSPRD